MKTRRGEKVKRVGNFFSKGKKKAFVLDFLWLGKKGTRERRDKVREVWSFFGLATRGEGGV